jgi:hypothetical protein
MTTNIISPDPYNILSKVKYYYPNSYASVYKKKETIKIIPKNLSNSNTIYKQIESQLKRDFIGASFESNTDGNWHKIRVTKGGRGSIHILKSKKKNSDLIAKPGFLYEVYFHSVLLDGISYTKDRRDLFRGEVSESILNNIPYMNFSLVVNQSNKKTGIGNIKSSSLVGGNNQKPDVIIYRTTGSPVRISLKQSNFFHWSGADTLSRFSQRAKTILSNSIEKGLLSLGDDNKVVFPFGVKGIRVPATRDEIKYYVFGEGGNSVEYVMINAIFDYYDEHTNITYMKANRIYKKNYEPDINLLMGDVFLIITEKYIKPNPNTSSEKEKIASPTAMSPYKGIRVSFVNRSHAFDPRNRYVDGVR